MKILVIYLSLIFFSNSTNGQCQSFLDSIVNNFNEKETTLIYNYKKLPKKIKKAFEKEIIGGKVYFSNLSNIRYKLNSRKKPLIFLFSIWNKENEIVLAVYNTDGLASYGTYYFFTINEKGNTIKICSMRKLEMIVDWNRIESIINKKEYDRSIPPSLLRKK